MLKGERMLQQDLEQQFSAMRAGDADPSDLAARLLVVASCGVALWLATGQQIMLIWGFGYAVLNILFAVFLRREVSRITHQRFWLSFVISAGIATWYGAMVVYIATLGGGDYLLLAACGVVGAALHCLSSNSALSYSAYIDMGTVVLSGLGVLVAAANVAPTFWVTVATVLGGICVIGYFALAFHQIMRDRETLNERIRADIQDQKMRALGQLTSGVAHDFNNLLAVMSMAIELSQGTTDADERARYLDDARRAADSGAELIKQLMAYVHKAQLQMSEVRLADLFERLSSVLPRVLPAHITLTIEPVDPGCSLQGDPDMLESALLNLVINARDAIGSDAGRIRISAWDDATSDLVSLQVADDGPGMDADTLERASESFFTTKRVGDGSGLGLSMVKGFSEQSGGRLTLENSASGGLIARLSLPRANAAAPLDKPLTMANAPAA